MQLNFTTPWLELPATKERLDAQLINEECETIYVDCKVECSLVESCDDSGYELYDLKVYELLPDKRYIEVNQDEITNKEFNKILDEAIDVYQRDKIYTI